MSDKTIVFRTHLSWQECQRLLLTDLDGDVNETITLDELPIGFRLRVVTNFFSKKRQASARALLLTVEENASGCELTGRLDVAHTSLNAGYSAILFSRYSKSLYCP